MKKQFIQFNAKKLSRKQQKRVWILLMAKLGFGKLTPEAKVEKAEQIVGLMTGNANFPTPTPTLASVTAAADALWDAQQALDGSELKTYERNVAEAALDNVMSKLQAYVDWASSEDPAKILSAGFEVRDPRTKAEILPAPQYLQANMTDTEGQIKLKFTPVKKKLFYLVEVALDVPAPYNWEIAAQSSKASVLINDLQPGQKYRIRVRTVNTAGVSAPSEEVNCRTFQY